MNGWNQPLCRVCYVSFRLGHGLDPHVEPVKVPESARRCLVCGEDSEGIWVRIDPKLTEHFALAVARDE
jgi:hypothetical protein